MSKLPPAKLRRSNIDWAEYLPPHLASQQIGFERDMTALAMRGAGMKFREIGDAYGVCKGRASQIVAKGGRRQRGHHPCPAEQLYAGKLAGPITPTERKQLRAFFAQGAA